MFKKSIELHMSIRDDSTESEARVRASNILVSMGQKIILKETCQSVNVASLRRCV